MKKKESILKRADDVVNHRSEEKERQYGPFSEGMERAAKVARAAEAANALNLRGGDGS